MTEISKLFSQRCELLWVGSSHTCWLKPTVKYSNLDTNIAQFKRDEQVRSMTTAKTLYHPRSSLSFTDLSLSIHSGTSLLMAFKESGSCEDCGDKRRRLGQGLIQSYVWRWAQKKLMPIKGWKLTFQSDQPRSCPSSLHFLGFELCSFIKWCIWFGEDLYFPCLLFTLIWICCTLWWMIKTEKLINNVPTCPPRVHIKFCVWRSLKRSMQAN